MSVVALLQPGDMGSRLGGELVHAGHRVRWLATGRSPATRDRAEREGLRAADDPAALVHQAETVLSVVPPQLAVQMAELSAAAGFGGTYVDANPISPATLSAVRRKVETAGARFVDAGVVGPPPRDGARTSLYLAGDGELVELVAALFASTRVTPIVVGSTIGQASAAKQAYALFNKGRMVLASMSARLAAAYDVTDVLTAEGDRPGADLLAELDDVSDGLADVGWRWGPEMTELARALESAGIDPTIAQAMSADLERVD